MKSNELRCGNMVLYKPYGNREGELVTIAGVLGMKAYFNKYTNESGMLHALMPIPLTPEVFQKCTLARNFPIVACFGTIKGVQLRPETYRIQIGEDYGRSIDYLHELQNIHFDLMGEELTLKEIV